jgi:hypothetical protein
MIVSLSSDCAPAGHSDCWFRPSIELRGALFFCLPSKESAAACSIPQAALLCRGIANPVQRAVPTASAEAKVSLTPH